MFLYEVYSNWWNEGEFKMSPIKIYSTTTTKICLLETFQWFTDGSRSEINHTSGGSSIPGLTNWVCISVHISKKKTCCRKK